MKPASGRLDTPSRPTWPAPGQRTLADDRPASPDVSDESHARAARHHGLPRIPRAARARQTARAAGRPEPVRAALRQPVARGGGRCRRSPACAASASGSCSTLEGERFVVIHLMIAGRLRWQPGGRASRRASIALAAFDFPTGTLALTEAGTQAPRLAPPGARARPRSRRSTAAASRCSTRRSEAFAARLATREPHAQARAHRSAPLQRHRQRLLRRDPAPRPAVAAGADARSSSDDDDRPAVRGDADDADRVDRAPARRGRRRVPREGDRVPRRGWPCTAGTASRARTAARRCSGSATRTTRRTTAPRCQTGGRLLADRAMSRLLREDWPRSIDEVD